MEKTKQLTYKLECIYKSGTKMFAENINEDRLEFFLDNLVLDRNVMKVIVTRDTINEDN
jgi:hypothetical protein